MPMSDGLIDDSRGRGPRPPRQTGIVGGKEVEWRRWSDYGELYSGCTLSLSAQNHLPPFYEVELTVTAKTEARRRTLEERLASLRLTFSAPPSGGGPKG
jgi:hypothetical protein